MMKKVRNVLRNFIAKDLRTPKYRKRIAKNPKAYARKPKHAVKSKEIADV
jgi:hypothetical protein